MDRNLRRPETDGFPTLLHFISCRELVLRARGEDPRVSGPVAQSPFERGRGLVTCPPGSTLLYRGSREDQGVASGEGGELCYLVWLGWALVLILILDTEYVYSNSK